MSLRWHQQLYRFAGVGIIGFIIDAGIVFLLTQASIDPIMAQLVAFSVAVTGTWWLNRKHTFAHAAGESIGKEWFRYVLANGVGGAINNGVYMLLVIHIAWIYHYPVVGVACGSLAGMFFNFFASKHIVFNSRKEIASSTNHYN